MRLLFRADASRRIGSGHVMRCLTLARALRGQGAEPCFASRLLDGHLGEAIAAEFPFVPLPASYPGDDQSGAAEAAIDWQADLAALAGALGNQRYDCCVVDHYGLDARWEAGAQAFAGRLMAIDDLANRPHAAQLLLDQNLTAAPAAYAGLLPPACRTLLGPGHALLREEFAVAGERDFAAQARRVLVSFGGADPTGETRKALRALARLDGLEVEVIAGAANPGFEAIVADCAAHGWRAERQVNDMAARMRAAEIFVGAGGATSWERAALGLPTVCIAVADNQRANAELLAACGAQVYLGAATEVGEAAIADAVARLAADRDGRAAMARAAQALVDGQGTARVCAALWAMNREH